MGARSWEYFAPYNIDVPTTLDDLQQRLLRGGRFHLSSLRPLTILRALLNAGATGTRSILDIERVASRPGIGTVSPISRNQLLAIFGTDRPTRRMVEDSFWRPNAALDEVIEQIERGEGRYIVIYDGEEPTEVFFIGYSCD